MTTDHGLGPRVTLTLEDGTTMTGTLRPTATLHADDQQRVAHPTLLIRSMILRESAPPEITLRIVVDGIDRTGGAR